MTVALLCPAPIRAGEFDEIRKSVRSEPPSGKPETERPRKERKRRNDDDVLSSADDTNFFGLMLGWTAQGAIYGITAPVWAPISMTGDEFYRRGVIVSSPYWDADFSMLTGTAGEADFPALFGRLQLDYGTNFADLDRIGGQLLVETPWRLGLDTTWTNWWEHADHTTDQLQLGDFNLVYRFAQSADIQFRAGVGVNWMSDMCGADIGFNFTYGVDYFPRKPWTISTSFDVGTLGHAGLFHNQTTLGCVVRRCEFFTGFDYYRIGGGELSAWINGVRIRF